MRRHLTVVGLLATAGAAAFQPAAAQSYDLVGQFSLSANPNGVWTYVSEAGALTKTQSGQSPGIEYWWNGESYPNASVIGANISGSIIKASTTVWVPNALHLDPQGAGAIVDFTAPTAGTYNFSGLFESLDTFGNSHQVDILVGNKVLESFNIGAYGSQANNFNFNAKLAQGEQVSFAADHLGTANQCEVCYLSTGLSVVASLLPFVSIVKPGYGSTAVEPGNGLPATGFTADGAAALFVTLTSETPPASATVTVTNEATLAPYDNKYVTSAPTGRRKTLEVKGSDIYSLGKHQYILCLVQAPDILKRGPDGNFPQVNQPVNVTVNVPKLGAFTSSTLLYPPPVMFVHGLWGTETSLQNMENYLAGVAPYSGLPSGFLNAFQYENDAAFDSSTVQSVVTNQVNTIISTLDAANISVGRVDVVAHSMGGLVARSFSAQTGYSGEPSRTLGLFHQVVTIDTPETGSLLANFLINNAAATFSPTAPGLARRVRREACPSATTVQSCLSELSENLAPAGQPISAGAVYSLQPGSPDIAGLREANIPHATWHALGATVSQRDNLIGANALVFELGELIAATCPGASYCPNESTPPPTLGAILQSNANDGIVTIASQTDSAHAPIRLAGLAHTTAADAGALSHYVLSYSNVLNSAAVNTQVGNWLANSSAPAPSTSETRAPAAPWRGFDATRPWRENNSRIAGTIPLNLAMGTPFPLRIHFPAEKIKKVWVTERDAFHTPLEPFTVPVERTAYGDAIIHVTPLLQGDVQIRVRAEFSDYASADRELVAHVAPPEAAPAGFWADNALHRLGGPMVMHLHLGGNPLWERGTLQPGALFTTVPDRPVWLKGGVTYRVLDEGVPPAVSVDAEGNVSALHEGTSTIVVSLGRFTAKLEAAVATR